MRFEDLTQEQLDKAQACASAEELIALAANESIELTEEQLNAIAGGTAFTAGTYEWNRTVWAKVTGSED